MKILITFYASPDMGSEYRSGWEYIRFAASLGFDAVVVADLDKNLRSEHPSVRSLGIKVVRVGSPVRGQSTLYRWSDFWVQQLWHRRVARWIKDNHNGADVIWVQNGAQVWQPLRSYYALADRLIWGPVGGGESAPARYRIKMRKIAAAREQLRSAFQGWSMQRKRNFLASSPPGKVLPIARTKCARELISKCFPGQSIAVVPEIIWPIRVSECDKFASSTPQFLWVGQDIPRKNLDMGLALFRALRAERFPNATLDVFGATRLASEAGVTYHGWVSSIDWRKYRDAGVLLLTSYREGLPSAILEALNAGLYCVSTDVGSISEIHLERLLLLSINNYPEFSCIDLERIANGIESHINAEHISACDFDFEGDLREILEKQGIV